MKMHDRRTFLKLAAASAAVATPACGRAFGTILDAGSTPAVKAWQTASGKRFQPIAAPVWKTGVPTQAMSIHLDPERKYQDILGFGAAMTGASCYLLQQAPEAKRRAILNACFGDAGLRFSVARTTIGSSDYSRSAYTFDDSPSPDPQLKHFSIAHDKAYILPVLRDAVAVNPKLFYFSSPWSPPAWMKANDSLLGGAMVKKYFPAYAEYFVKFLRSYEAEGVKIRAVTVQNEVDTNQGGRMPQCEWGQEYEMDFVKLHLGPLFAQQNIGTKIWILDHNYDLWGRAVDELSDPDVYKYVDGVAWHGYVGAPDAMTRVHDMFPDKNAYWTEGGPDITDPAYATDWSQWSETFTGILRNWARCIVSWNLVLNEKGQPDIGPFSCGGVVTLHSKTNAVTRSGQFWAFAHYSKLIDRGSRVIGSWGELPHISHVAAENPDGSRVLVLTNRGGEQPIQVTLHDQAMEVVLPPDSITSLKW